MHGISASAVYRFVAVSLVAIALWGCGEAGFYTNEIRAEVFHQRTVTERADILWVLDNSDSMEENRQFVEDNLSRFMTMLRRRKAVDFSMAVVTTDYFKNEGRLQEDPNGNAVVTSQTADYENAFRAIVDNIESTKNSSYWEQGLEASYQAINKEGQRFLRHGTPLYVVYLSDEEDSSCAEECWGEEPEHNNVWVPFPTQRYIKFFNQFPTRDGKDAFLFPIVGTDTSACAGVDVGYRYLDVQLGVGKGVSGSICAEDIAASFDNVAGYMADLGVAFPLKERASPSTLRVFVDRDEVFYSEENGFSYDLDKNTLYFNGPAVPKLGSVISVSYSVAK